MKHVLQSAVTFHFGSVPPQTSAQELRCAVRFPLTLPMVVHKGAQELPAISVNVSSSGVLFETLEEIPVGENISFSLQMPGVVLGSLRDILVECHGRVVRCSMSYTQPQIAATIDDYRFVER